jgi:hypothetical protein
VAELFARHYVACWESAMPKKTAKPFRVKKTDGRQSNGGGVLEMTDRDRDRFLTALDRRPKPLPELERAALLRACATGGECAVN